MQARRGARILIAAAIRERWSSRELERQLKALFERTVLSPPQASPAVIRMPRPLAVFKDAYLVEFLELPRGYSERDLHRGLLLKLKDFLVELGRDFCFVGSEFPCRSAAATSRSTCCSSTAA